ncbi:hypothetical protein [Hwangdonia lutea]|uniref:Uncharacterized protein n=1 Tax=Hwangdonia lutea TaxID=3075823 RepID=A0AA97HRN6_9FLAO|nr:hypothetical protein [Hwangdonia sp. SCSIO 19198]WOD45046.1 hypothetical protein RNZ46_07205 [Hwangdonia sp. SCSIO 19198]
MEYKSDRFNNVWEDILQIWFSGYLDIITSERRNQISPQSHLKKIKIITTEFVKDVFKIFIKNKIPKKKVWFFSISSNNHEALKLIKNNIDNAIFVVPYSFKLKFKDSYPLNFNYKFFYDLLFLFKLFFFKPKNHIKKKECYDLLFKANGVFTESIRCIKKNKPKGIVFANDHEIVPRGLLLAAKFLEIPTFYIQHASVSKYFPALDFDYALLEGQDSKDKYLGIGKTNSEVHLVGMPKFDNYINHVNTNKVIKKIGVAYNAMDDVETVIDLVNNLKHSFPAITFVVRAHPSDKRELKLSGVKKSLSKKESAFSFLKQIDALIAAESSIHLEAVMLNVYSMSFSFNKSSFLDYYDFVKNDLIKHFNQIDDLKTEISNICLNKPNIQQRATYYNASLNSVFYGKSVKKICEIIKSKV